MFRRGRGRRTCIPGLQFRSRRRRFLFLHLRRLDRYNRLLGIAFDKRVMSFKRLLRLTGLIWTSRLLADLGLLLGYGLPAVSTEKITWFNLVATI